MSDFPPNLSIRPLTIEDIEQCISLENKGFPESERCSPEKFKYRLTVCPELCSGLFIRDYKYKYNAINLPEVAEKLEKEYQSNKEEADDDDEDLDKLPIKSSVTKETLIGHIISTKTSSPRITDSSMELPSDDDETAGHHEHSRYIGIHSVVIDPEWQGKNLGTLMMHDYIQKLSNQDLGDRVSLIAKTKLIPFYEKIGFTDLGASLSKHGGVSWNDLTMDLIPEEDE